MIGAKFYKSNYNQKEYEKSVKFCDENGCTIVDKGEYYEVVEIPQPSLGELKAAKLAELKAQRDSKEVAPIEYNGNLYDYDEKARDRINAAIIALELQGESTSIDWTTADNQDVKVTANDLRCVIATVAVRSNALHIAYRIAKEKVEEATTAAEVESIILNV